MRLLVSRNYWVYVEPEFEKVKKIMKGSGGCGAWLKVEGILKYQTTAENRIYKANDYAESP